MRIDKLLASILIVFGSLASAAGPPLDIGSRVEPLVDAFLIDRLDGDAALHLHKPKPQEVALVADAPWEGNTSAYYTVFRDDDVYRVYYRGGHFDEQTRKSTHAEVVCYAESKDGIHWTKPELGLVEFDGAKNNNIIWNGLGTHNFTPFKDTNPACAEDARYKALGVGKGSAGHGLYAFKSSDAIHWSLLSDKPVITKGAFDSQNLAFWDSHVGVYREFHRDFRGVRDILTGTSPDFLHWTDPVFLEYPDAPKEHLYTNAVLPCPRAPHILIAFPTRFHPERDDQVEPTFMTSRDGRTFHRWTEALIPVTAPKDRDGNRSNYMAWGVVQLPGDKRTVSVYATEAYYTGPDSRLRRFTYRVDGFVSVRAAAGGGLLTKPLQFSGNRLIINYAARDQGSVSVEVQNADGRVIDGFALADCDSMTGDKVAHTVCWRGGNDLSSLAGKPIRLRFQLKNADLYSLQFVQKKKELTPIPKVEESDQICFALYTTQNGTMKMLVQLYPLADGDSRDVVLEMDEEGSWVQVAETKIREDSYGMKNAPAKAWNALFRVENWDTTKDWKYRVSALDGVATYAGTIRRDPVDKDEIVVAAFTGNSIFDQSMRPDIIENIKAIDPDLLFFSGDQSYDHQHHLAAWLLFGRQFGEIIKDRPTVCIPDDHDVGQGNLWGAGGKKSTGRGGCADGGYAHPVKYVREVEFAQTANLPDPLDPTPIQRGIGVHTTSLNVGGIDFAIIEDRKFKSGPLGLVETPGHKRPDLIGDPNYDRKSVDHPDAKLLGERQLKFLDVWAKDWRGAEMKCVLSATIFCQGCHLTGPWRVVADLDSNGWPQTGRDKALRAIRKAFAFMLAGDQHLATVIHQGVEDWSDSGYSFCVPSIVNYWPRKWLPLDKPHGNIESPLPYAGEYFDGFGNRVTMLAYANPGDRKEVYGPKDKGSAGFGVVRFNKRNRAITMECWPRECDVTKSKYTQYPGWPITISQEDNYSRKAVAWLPEIQCKSMVNPVVQVIDEKTGETVYTIRVNGRTWRPKVFEDGTYCIKVGGQGAGELRTFAHVESRKDEAGQAITIP